MRKAVYNKTGTRQIINSDWKEFNAQTNSISPGNVISNTQYSSYIRPYGLTNNGYETVEPGRLMRFDLQYFKEIPRDIGSIIRDPNRTQSVILYEFFIRRNGEKIVFGHVLTDKDYHYLLHSIVDKSGTNRKKRETALLECMNYICDK